MAPTKELKKIPEGTDVMSVKDFKMCCENGLFTDDDGIGYYATSIGLRSNKIARPSEIKVGIIDWTYTHVAWFNKRGKLNVTKRCFII